MSGEKRYYLANLPAKTDLRTLAATIKARWICEQAHQQMKEELGLDLFEGRWAPTVMAFASSTPSSIPRIVTCGEIGMVAKIAAANSRLTKPSCLDYAKREPRPACLGNPRGWILGEFRGGLRQKNT
jgi:hypothetical protein